MSSRRAPCCAALLLPLLACGAEVTGVPEAIPPEPTVAAESAISIKELAATGALGLSPHFRAWLARKGYAGQDFARADLTGGSFGGQAGDADRPQKDPVIFVHGNSDRAVGVTTTLSGWTPVLRGFLASGYRPAELYAITWGPADPAQAAAQYHSRAHLVRLRAFVEAVLAYTGAARVDVIGHSMGVTLMRKVIAGGPAQDLLAPGTGDYDLGPSLAGRVDTFVGISGANQGLALCYGSVAVPTCGATNGLYPGYFVGLLGPYGVSRLLVDINGTGPGRRPGAHVYSIWSTVDEVIGGGNLVWGQRTSPIPGQDGEIRFSAAPYGHMNSKNLTAEAQVRLVRDHILP